jgi:membrane protease YdiL (CAAX protease family)
VENNSPSPISPAWPTRWPKDAFRPGPSLLWLLVVALGIAAGTLIAFIVVGAIYGPSGGPKDLVETLLVTVIIELCTIPFAWWFLPTAARVSLPNLGFARPTFATLGIAAGGAIVALIAVNLVTFVVDRFAHGPHGQATAIAFTGIHQLGSIAFFFVAATIVIPIAEETIFRLFVFNVGLRYGGFWLGAIPSAVLFGLAHGDRFNAPALAAVGLVLCAVYYFSKNAFASMIAHGLFNAITLVALLIDPSAAKG